MRKTCFPPGIQAASGGEDQYLSGAYEDRAACSKKQSQIDFANRPTDIYPDWPFRSHNFADMSVVATDNLPLVDREQSFPHVSLHPEFRNVVART